MPGPSHQPGGFSSIAGQPGDYVLVPSTIPLQLNFPPGFVGMDNYMRTQRELEDVKNQITFLCSQMQSNAQPPAGNLAPVQGHALAGNNMPAFLSMGLPDPMTLGGIPAPEGGAASLYDRNPNATLPLPALNQKDYPKVPWTKDDYIEACGKGDSSATVPGASKWKPGRPGKNKYAATMEDNFDRGDSDTEGRSSGRLKQPMHGLNYITDESGIIVSDARMAEMRGYSRGCWNDFLRVGHAPRTWKNKNSAAIQDIYYSKMKDKFREFRLADGDWKIELFAVANDPSNVRNRKAEFDRQEAELAAQLAPAPTKKKKKMKTKGKWNVLEMGTFVLMIVVTVLAPSDTKDSRGHDTNAQQAPRKDTNIIASLDHAPFCISPDDDDIFMVYAPAEQGPASSKSASRHKRDNDNNSTGPARKQPRTNFTSLTAELAMPEVPAAVIPMPSVSNTAWVRSVSPVPLQIPSLPAPESASSAALETIMSPATSPEPELFPLTAASEPVPVMPVPVPAVPSPTPFRRPSPTPGILPMPMSAVSPLSPPSTSSHTLKLQNPLCGVFKDCPPPPAWPSGKRRQEGEKRNVPVKKTAAKPWPPSPSNCKNKAACARIWHVENPAGTEAEFNIWYKEKSPGFHKTYMKKAPPSANIAATQI
ncbi:hypothetical protein C8T65DRAFT_736753 [Cerioporus squamosus]|nr:hypothetical protein C8T65DRAFT_736753 [Cerioporus squamosus]